MFAVKDKRSGKFLRSFSGSLNHAERHLGYYKLRKKLGREPTAEEQHNELWNGSASDAKIYKNMSGITNSFHSYCFKRIDDNQWTKLSLSKALPGLEIVEVKIRVA